MFNQNLENAEEPDIKLPTYLVGVPLSFSLVWLFSTPWIIRKAREFQKNIYFCFIDFAKAIVWITTNCGKFFKKWEYQTTFPASWKICIQVKKQQLEPDIEQWTASKLRKEYVKAVYCHPAYLICMQSTSWEMPGWMKHKLESRLLEEISITSDMQMTPPSKQRRTEKSLEESKRREWKGWLKTQHSEN